MKKKIYALSLDEEQVKILYDSVAQTLGLKRLYNENESEMIQLEDILKRLGEIDLMIQVNKAQDAFIRKAQDGK